MTSNLLNQTQSIITKSFVLSDKRWDTSCMLAGVNRTFQLFNSTQVNCSYALIVFVIMIMHQVKLRLLRLASCFRWWFSHSGDKSFHNYWSFNFGTYPSLRRRWLRMQAVRSSCWIFWLYSRTLSTCECSLRWFVLSLKSDRPFKAIQPLLWFCLWVQRSHRVFLCFWLFVFLRSPVVV